MPAASYGSSEPRVSMTRFSTSSRSSERLIVFVISSSMRSLSTVVRLDISGSRLFSGVAINELWIIASAAEDLGCVVVPQPRYLDPKLDQCSAHAIMTGDLLSRLPLGHHSLEGGI